MGSVPAGEARPHGATPLQFHSTRWSLVLRSRGDNAEARLALEELLEAYWYPLYAFLRRMGEDDPGARDGVQGFWLHALETDLLARVDPAQGRLRSYLLGALRKHHANEVRSENALKRGGGRAPLRLDAEEGDARFAAEPSHGEEPGAAFDRDWAHAVLGRARARLAEECAERGRGNLLEMLEETLDGTVGERSHAERAELLGLSEGAVKVAAHRLRKRLGELIREEVAQTLDGVDGVGAEITLLLRALAEPGRATSGNLH